MKVLWMSLALAAMLSTAAGCARPASLVGTVMTTTVPAVDFSLTDQKGAAYSLAASKGRVAVFSFIYTHCDDTCPFIALKIKEAQRLLGPLAGKVEFVAVTTDPERDTPQLIAAYSREAGLYDSWHFVTGPAALVRKVWIDFGVGVHRVEEADPHEGAETGMAAMEDDAAKGLSKADLELAGTLGEKFGGATRSPIRRPSGSSTGRGTSGRSSMPTPCPWIS